MARERWGALRDGALRAHGAIGWEQFAAGGSTRIEADTVSSWDYNCRKSVLSNCGRCGCNADAQGQKCCH